MKRFLLLINALLVSMVICQAAKKPKVIKITVEPKEAAIYVNNTLSGYGYAEFTRPKKKNEVVIIRCECNEYKPILTKFYGEDKRSSLSFALQQDGFYRASAASGVVNKFFTIDLDSLYYQIDGDKVNASAAWKLLHHLSFQILQRKQNILLYRKMRIQRIILKHQPHAPVLRRQVSDIVLSEKDPPGSRFQKAARSEERRVGKECRG